MASSSAIKIGLRYRLYFLLCVFLSLNILSWSYARDFHAEWINVPPAPGKIGSVFFALGDKQLAYRSYGVMLQNLGDSAGDIKPLTSYNYDRLGKWFLLEDYLDPRSDFIPLLAAYYFGATSKAEDLDPVIEYLAKVGRYSGEEKWRWLSHAVYLARFQQEDHDKALKHAYQLASIYRPGMPLWTKQMPAFVMNDMGNKEAAIQLILGIMADSGTKIHPNELNFMKYYICDRLLDAEQKEATEMCHDHY